MEFKEHKTIAILTTFQEFKPGYSLTGIAVNQAHMLLRQGHTVLLFVNEQYNPKCEEDAGITPLFKRYPDTFKILKDVKMIHLNDYQKDEMNATHKLAATQAGNIIADIFKEYKVSVAFTHDFVFTGWNLPYYHTLIQANNELNKTQENGLWYHWIHSVPTGSKDWWTLEPFGANHFLVFPNKTEIMRVAECFKVPPGRVKIIPHILDIRTWYDFGDDAMELIDRYPKIMDAQIIQVYPCSTDRLAAKQLNIVIEIFGHLKNSAKIPVFLIVANQWATGRQRKEDVQTYIEIAEKAGLVYGEDIVFTSETDDRHATGISKKMLRELQLLQNIFVFPTREESFGLVGPEAAMSGCLCIINRSLQMQMEVMSSAPPAFDFGSFHNETKQIDDPNYIRAVAMAIANRVYANEAIMTKIFCRHSYHMEAVYHRHYLANLG